MHLRRIKIEKFSYQGEGVSPHQGGKKKLKIQKQGREINRKKRNRNRRKKKKKKRKGKKRKETGYFPVLGKK